MDDDAPARPEHAPKFCPFCRDCFEGVETCPDHDIALVPFDALPKIRRPVRDNEVLAVFDLRYGRGVVLGGALLMVVGMALPLATTTVEEPLTVTGFGLAMTRAPHLWAVPLVAAAFISVLFRRRSLAAMRGARVAVPVLSLISATALGYTVMALARGAAQLGSRIGGGHVIPFGLEVGFWALVVGMVLATVGGLMLGVVRRPVVLPHGAGPEGAGAVIFDHADRDD
jgi:hypothetical protein